jgi:WD40 repeat protein
VDTHAVTSLAFGPDGQQLVSGSTDRTIRLWQVADGRRVWLSRITGFTGSGPLRSLRLIFSPDGQRLVSVAAGEEPLRSAIQFWDVRSGELAATLADDRQDVIIQMNPSSRSLFSCTRAGGMTVWEGGDPRALDMRLLRGQTLAIRAVGFSADKHIACASSDQSIVLYQRDTGRLDQLIPLDTPCTCLAFNPKKPQLAYQEGETRIALLGLTAGVPTRSLDNGSRVAALAYSPDGDLLAVGGEDNKARLWDVAAGKAVAVLADHQDRVSSVCFTHDGATLVTGSRDQKVRI